MPPPKGMTKLQVTCIREESYAKLYDALIETGMLQEVLDRLQDEFNQTKDNAALMAKVLISVAAHDVEWARGLKPHPDYDEYCYDYEEANASDATGAQPD